MCVRERDRAHVCVCGRCMNRKENVGYFVSEQLCERQCMRVRERVSERERERVRERERESKRKRERETES